MKRDTRARPAGTLGQLLGIGLLALATVAADEPNRAATTVVFTKPAGSLAILPGGQTDSKRVILGEPYVTSGFIKRELPTSATGLPYVSTGYLKVESDARGNPVPEPAPKVAKPQSPLAKRIEQACARMASDVVVRHDSPTAVQVSFKVRNLGDTEKVSRKILALPELLNYQVTFEVHVGP